MEESSTVSGIVEQMSKSQGFVLFVSMLVKKENGDIGLEHRYIRQLYIPEDLEKSFENFNALILKDLSESGENLIKSAERIVSMKSPVSSVEEAQFESTEKHEGVGESD